MDLLGPMTPHRLYPMLADDATLQMDGSARPTTQEAATKFEAMFVQQIIKTMRETVRAINPNPLFGGGQDAQIFMSMFDEQLAKGIAEEGGLGLADALVEQLDSHGSSFAADRPIRDSESLNNFVMRR